MYRASFLILAISLLVSSALAQRVVFTVEGTAAADGFGARMKSAGDVDADGIPDFMVAGFGGVGHVTVISGATQEILHSLSGTVGFFGFAFDGLGDIDGDGYADFAISEVPSGVVMDFGVVYVYSGATGQVIYSLDAIGADADIFGRVLSSCGDLDGDGLRDLLVQSLEFRNQAVQTVIAYSGGDGAELFRIETPSSSATIFADAFAGLGDTNGDGVDDFVIGDGNFIDSSGPSIIRGRALVYSGATRSILFSVLGTSTSHGFPRSLADAGDLDNDGFADILVGSELSSSLGMVQAVSGADGTDIYLLNGAFDGDDFGAVLGRAGDVDGDGREDFIVGAPRNYLGIISAGAAYVYSGATGDELFHVHGTGINDRLGSSVAAAGDLDGDGLDDVLVGRPFFITTSSAPGRVRCYALGGDPVLLDFELDDDFRTPLENGRSVDDGARFGRLVRITSDGPGHFGAAIFDSTPSGPNAGGADPDLLVDRGNLIVLQEDPAQDTPGIFTTPDDAQAGGTLHFELLAPGRPLSIDLVDVCPGPQDVTVRLIDMAGQTRTYDVPNGFTTDGVTWPALAVRTLSLATLEPQPGVYSIATASQDPDFDAGLVSAIEVILSSSGAVDRLRWVPADLPPPPEIDSPPVIRKSPRRTGFRQPRHAPGASNGGG